MDLFFKVVLHSSFRTPRLSRFCLTRARVAKTFSVLRTEFFYSTSGVLLINYGVDSR